MKSILKKILFATIVILFTGIVKAQDNTKGSDYVIKSAGDTVFCKISIPFFGGKDSYSLTADTNKSIKIRPNEIKEYYINRKDKLYQSVFKSGKHKPEFLNVIEKGKINLYEEIRSSYSMYGSTYTVIWYVSKGSNIVEELKFSSLIAFNKKKRKDEFSEMISDNKEVYDKFIAQDKKFTFSQIKSLTHLYNIGEWVE